MAGEKREKIGKDHIQSSPTDRIDNRDGRDLSDQLQPPIHKRYHIDDRSTASSDTLGRITPDATDYNEPEGPPRSSEAEPAMKPAKAQSDGKAQGSQEKKRAA